MTTTSEDTQLLPVQDNETKRQHLKNVFKSGIAGGLAGPRAFWVPLFCLLIDTMTLSALQHGYNTGTSQYILIQDSLSPVRM